MGKRGKLAKGLTARRDHVETAQAALMGLLVDVDEVILRNQQAMRRTGLVADVLEPAVKRLAEIRDDIRLAQRELGEAWSEAQSRRWSDGKG